MRSIARTLAATAFCIAMAAPILAQTVTIDSDPAIKFATFKTYTWKNVHATDPSVEKRITIAANRTLAGRYMKEAGSGGDITITAVEASQDKGEYATFYGTIGDFLWQRGWGSGGFMDSQATLQDIPLNTLVVDMYDTKSYKLIWRGTITLPAADATSKEADQKFDKAVTELISKYPPKYKQP